MKGTPFRPSAPIGGSGSLALSSPKRLSLHPRPPPTLTVSLSAAPLLQDGRTALLYTSAKGHSAVVEALLAKGADKEAKTKVRGL